MHMDNDLGPGKMSGDHACGNRSDPLYTWTARGVYNLKSNCVYEKYGSPQLGTQVPQDLDADPMWHYMVKDRWVRSGSIAPEEHVRLPDVEARDQTLEASNARHLEKVMSEPIIPSGSPSVSAVLSEWMAKNPGCTAEVFQCEDKAPPQELPTNLVVRGLLQELTAFDLCPWGSKGMTEVLKIMRDEKDVFAVSSPMLWEKGIRFLTPHVSALRGAASTAGNSNLADFVSQASLDPNVNRIFFKVFHPGSFINSSEWHQDQAGREHVTWSRCLIYQTSGKEGGSWPLHYIAFRRLNSNDVHVRVGFPHALAMSGPLRCGTIPVGGANVRFEHKGEPPATTACCFTMDVANLGCVLEDYKQYMPKPNARPSEFAIPLDLCTSPFYRVEGDQIVFMDQAGHAAWLEESGSKEYWERGGQAIKDAKTNTL